LKRSCEVRKLQHKFPQCPSQVRQCIIPASPLKLRCDIHIGSIFDMKWLGNLQGDTFDQFSKLPIELRERIWQYTWPGSRLIEVGRCGRDTAESSEDNDDRPFFLRIAGPLSVIHSIHTEQKKVPQHWFLPCPSSSITSLGGIHRGITDSYNMLLTPVVPSTAISLLMFSGSIARLLVTMSTNRPAAARAWTTCAIRTELNWIRSTLSLQNRYLECR
jgi:hypothetical protein